MTENENKALEYDSLLDTRGLFCPEPIFEVRNLSESLEVGQCFKVLADDPAAEEDITRFAKRTGHKILEFEKNDDGTLRFIIEKTK